MAIKDVILGYAKGEKGDPGPRGEKGNTGATGPKGDPGNIADAQITDTEGLDVAKGQKTTAQKLFDAIANRIVTKLVTNDALTKKLADYMLKGMMSNTNVNNTGTVPTSALMYSMFEQINNNLSIGKIPNKILYIGSTNDTDCNLLTKHFVLAKGKNFPTGDGFWYVQTIGYEIKPDGTVRTGKQIAYQYTGTKLFTRDCYNDVWDGWAEYTTKSDLALLSFTWTGEATNYIDTSITIDGYKPIAITGLNPTGLGTGTLRYFRFNKDNLRAIASFTTGTVTSCVFDVLCIRV